MMNKRMTGALPSPKDKRDYKFASIAGADAPILPYHSDVPDVILNQGISLQCGPCAIVSARYETEYRQTGEARELSRTCVYGKDYDLDEEGMYLRTLMNIALCGIPYHTSWESWGNKEHCRKLVLEHWTSELADEAYKLRGTAYYDCRTWKEVCNATRATYGSVVILVEVYDNWYNTDSSGVVGKNSGEFCGYHFLRVKDYEILPSGVYKIRCQNSWGKDWGDGGYCYLYSDINTFEEAKCLVDNVYEVVSKLMFKDVSANRWSADAIGFCADKGIMNGFPDGTFRPEEPVTREQLAAVIQRISDKE